MSYTRTAHMLLAAATLCLAATLTACSDKPEALLDSARQFMQKNQYKAAIIQIKNVLQTNSNLGEARFLLGTALLESGDAAGAEAELRKALELHYTPDNVLPALARALLAQNHAVRVTQEFAQAQLGGAAARADLQLSLSTAYAMQNQPEQSASALQAALQADPGFTPARLAQARQLAQQGDMVAAQAQLERVLALAPRNHEAWKLQGDLYAHAEGHGEDALQAYRQAVTLRPDDVAGQNALMLLLLQQTKLDAATTQLQQLQKVAANHPYTLYLEALLAYQKKDYKSVHDLLQRTLNSLPNNLPALELAGASELQQLHLTQAEGYLSRAVQAAPTRTMARRLLVVTYLRMQQPTKARETLLPGLREEPVDASLLALAGEVFFRNGDLARAQTYFDQARAKSPSDGRLRTSLALVDMAQNPPAAGLDALRDISASDTGATADMALISTLMQRRDFEPALKAIAVLEKKQPRQPLAPYLRSRVLLATNQTGHARDSLERALSVDGGYYPAIAALAAMDLADQKPLDARKRIEAFLQLQPKHAQALLALADIASRTGAPTAEVAKLLSNAVVANPGQVDARLLLIELYLNNKDFKNATAAAQSAVVAMPDEPRVVDALGRSLQAMGDTNQALLSYRRLTELMPQSALPYWRLADAQLGTKDRTSAMQSLEKALAIQPDFLDGQRALIALYLAEKQQDQALEIAHKVQSQRPKEDLGYVMQADILATGKQWDKAAAALRAGLKLVSTTPMAMKLHTSLQAAGKGPEAEQFSAQWQKDHPLDAAFKFYLGDQAMARKDYAAAEQYFSAVLKQQPESAIALNNLAWVSSKLKKPGAVTLAEKAVALAPQNPDYIDTLASLRSENGDYAQAVELQNRAMALQPRNPMLKLNLAIIHLRAGKRELAKKPLDELSALGDGFPGQARVASMQKELARP
jgi:cellulose synthase operon protein C